MSGRFTALPASACRSLENSKYGKSLTDVGADEVRQKLQALDINGITPLEALGILSELKKKIEA